MKCQVLFLEKVRKLKYFKNQQVKERLLCLTLNMQHLIFSSLLFSPENRFYAMYETICMKCQTLFSGKKTTTTKKQ